MITFRPNEQRRIDVAVSVRATDAIAKVENAGATELRGAEIVQIMHNGVLVRAGGYQGELMTEIIRRLHGHHEPQEEVVFHALMKRLAGAPERAVTVELGSFWSYYSLWARQALTGVESYMVEPDQHNLAVGRANFCLNDAAGNFFRAAVGTEHGTDTFMQGESGAIRRTPVITVDGFMREHAIERIDVLLCDIQGAELTMLKGALEALTERRIRFMLISTHHHTFCGDPLMHQRCREFLHQHGAHVIAEHSISESCSGDGLIAVSFDPRDADFVVEIPTLRSRDTVFGEVEYELQRLLSPLAPLHRVWWLLRRKLWPYYAIVRRWTSGQLGPDHR